LPKPELELFDTEMIPWRPVEGEPEGVYEKILSRDEETGSYTRLLKFAPGLKLTEVLAHDFWEEVYIISGVLIDTRKKLTFGPGFYACRPPGMLHGPYEIPIGCTTLETRTFVR